ncbi:MAG: invasin domain 3-containing protein [Bacillota bacterium]
MRKLSHVLAAVLIVATLIAPRTGSVARAASLPVDVAGTAFETAVKALVDIGVMGGYTDGTFRPGNPITRAEVAAVLIRALGLEAQAQAQAGPSGFSDAPQGYWATGYIKLASERGLVEGFAGRFRPQANVTYAEIATMLVRLTGYDLDARTSPWPGGYIAVAERQGLTLGTSFSQDAAASRGDVALMARQAIYGVKVSGSDKTLAQSVFNVYPSDAVVKVEIAPSEAEVKKGDSLTLVAKAYNNVGKLLEVPMQWAAPTDMLVIDNKGQAVAVGAGEATVTVTAGGVIATAKVRVYGPPSQMLVTVSPERTIANGQNTVTVMAMLLDDKGHVSKGATNEVVFALNNSTLGTLSQSIVKSTNGIAQTTLTTTRNPGAIRVLATCTGIAASEALVTTYAATPEKVVLTAEPSRIASDGVSKTWVKATLFDNSGVEMTNTTGQQVTVVLANSNPNVGLLNQNAISIPMGQSSTQVAFTATALPGSATLTGYSTYGGVVVEPVTITTGPVSAPHHLAIRAIKDTAANGSEQMKVYAELRDSSDNVVTGNSSTRVDLTLLHGFISSGNLVSTTANGVAAFYITSIKAGDVELRATAPGLNLVPTTGVGKFVAGPASKLVLESPVGTTVSADAIGIIPIVARITDAQGNTVTNAAQTVTLIHSSGAKVFELPDNLTAQPVAGVATFKLKVGSIPGTESLQANSGGLYPSNILNMTAAITGYPNKVIVQPVMSATAGVEFEVKVHVLDSLGNLMTSDSGRKVYLYGDATTVINSPQVSTNGVAVFKVTQKRAGGLKLWTESPGLTSDTTGQTITVATGVASKVKLTATPENVAADGRSISTITASLTDEYGNPITSYEQVTLSVDNSSVGSLSQSWVYLNPGSSVQFRSTTLPGSVTINGQCSSYIVDPLTIRTYLAGEPVKAVIETNTPVKAGFGEDGTNLSIKVKIVDANGNLVTGVNTGSDITAAGVIVTNVTGSSHITVTNDYGLAAAGLVTNIQTIGAAAIQSGVAILSFTDSRAETVTLTPFVVYKGSRLAGVPSQATITASSIARLSVTATPGSIRADGLSTAVIEAVITDIYGNPVPGASDVVTFTPSTNDFLTVPTTLTMTTSTGRAAITVTSKAGTGGSTTIRVSGAMYSPAGVSVTVATDALPGKPAISALDSNGNNTFIDPGELGVRLYVVAPARNSPQVVHAYVNGVEVPLYTTAGGSTACLPIDAGQSVFTGYINRVDLGTPGVKEIRVLLTSGMGAGTLSDPVYVTVVP